MWKCPELLVLLRVKRSVINQEALAGTGQLALSGPFRERFDQEAFTLAMSSLLKKRLTTQQDYWNHFLQTGF